MTENPDRAVRTMAMIGVRPGMSFEEFDHYWREVHAQYVADIPEITRYTQRHIVPGDEPDNPFGIDGFVILEYENLEAKQAAWASDLGKAALADADKFRALSARVHFEDHVILDRNSR
ncbi:EthD family reductase [Rhodococcus koreensis]|uniref:EthD family reductase n=1 Tax=Rhodococcus koreensis TaxID=99653 RepID=UPI00367272EF